MNMTNPTKSSTKLKLLFADDERSLQELMRLELPRMGHEVTVCPDGATALAALERNVYDCLLVDLDMPGANGLEVVARAKQLAPDTEAVILTGKSSLETAVAALRYGAFDYLTKPCKLADLGAVLRRVAEKRELTYKYRALKQRLERLEGSSQLVGTSPPMEAVRRMIAKVAPTNSTVLICGETGTGKELVARALHDQSLRADMPLVPINCGALPENLIESELFGHRKGAFTGAEEHRTGLFQVANGGTLFLDEIGELPKTMQAKLLRFLESGEIRRVGDNESLICDVRVICATNRRLDQMVADGRIPRRPLVPHQHFRNRPAAVARADRRHPAAGPPPRDPQGDSAGLRRRAVFAGNGRGPAATRLARQRAGVGQRGRARPDPLRPGARSFWSIFPAGFAGSPSTRRWSAARRQPPLGRQPPPWETG